MQDQNIKYANIVFPIPVDMIFTYLIPEEFRNRIQVGMRILAPFGKNDKETEGVVVGLTAEEPEIKEIKEILDVIDEEPFYSKDILSLTKWISEYYLSSWGEALKCATPAGISTISKRFVSINEIPDRDKLLAELTKTAPRQAQVLTALIWEGKMTVQKLKTMVESKGIYSTLSSLASKGYINISTEVSAPMVKPKTARAVRLAKSPDDLKEILETLKISAPKQAEILEILISEKGQLIPLSRLAKLARTSLTDIKALEKKELVVTDEIEIIRDPLEGEIFDTTKNLKLNPDQENALREISRAIDKERSEVFLIFGVTASGKTEVYMQAIGKVLEKGKSAIVLVPEISLTPQTVFRFASRFGNRVTVLHSKMSEGERYDQWRRIKSGQSDIVVGARSAIFAPMPNLGLIVVDEEHETSYKQEDSPRYHARDVAIKRAEITNSIVVLGSATPSLESFYLASKKKYNLVSLPMRVDNVILPPVEIVDMRAELTQKHNRSIFSISLQEAIEDRLAREEQTILFLNRRGFSTFVLCRECGYVAKCRNCDISLTYHSSGDMLVCHHCNFRQPPPVLCPICKGNYIRHFGTGTQKVEESARKAFPEASIERMDVDTTTRKGAYKRILDAFKNREIDILIGTQIIAKGLDFPNVTLVGVISADTAINLPDFRSAERTFNLLTQVAGRAGRGEAGGEVIIQTYNPEHYSILAAKDHDYRSFYRQEIANRELLSYPPFTHFATILLKGKSENLTANTAETLESIMRSIQEANYPDLEILGPAPAPLAKIKQYYRWHIILKSVEPKNIRGLFEQTKKNLPSAIIRGDVIMSIDMDPLTLL